MSYPLGYPDAEFLYDYTIPSIPDPIMGLVRDASRDVGWSSQVPVVAMMTTRCPRPRGLTPRAVEGTIVGNESELGLDRVFGATHSRTGGSWSCW